jgi:peptidoglycan/LPS O-acetylase OafA/YrhL
MQTTRSVQVDALRGIAAISVLLAHGDAFYLIYHPAISQEKANLGHFGVVLFFILSGALIWRSAGDLRKGGALSTYVINRATRILPLYWASIAFCIILVPLIGSHYAIDGSPSTVLRHLTFTQTMPPDVSRAINPVLWTLAYEAAFYVAVPLVLRWAHPALWLCLASALLYLTGNHGWLYASMFGVGMAFEELSARNVSVTVRLAGVAAILAAFASWWTAGDWFIPLTATSAAMLYFVRLPSFAVRPLIPFAGVGIISYSLYIWHYVLLELIGYRGGEAVKLFGDLWQSGGFRAAVTISIVGAFSALSFLLIERPAMSGLRAWLLRSRPASLTDVAESRLTSQA